MDWKQVNDDGPHNILWAVRAHNHVLQQKTEDLKETLTVAITVATIIKLY